MLLHVVLPSLLALLSALGFVRGVPMISRSLGDAESDGAPLLLLQGGRWAIAAAALACLAAGLFASSTGLAVFGLVFLLEELYETTVALSILRWGRARGMI